jgi:hypothetical protein
VQPDATPGLSAIPFDSGLWAWGATEPEPAQHLGRACIHVEAPLPIFVDVELLDGAIELELAVTRERSFHGVVWRGRDAENYESFFVRPHQVGNPDAIQYTPVFNGISSWQLYHGPGYWAPIPFPIGEWFRIRVVFAGERAEAYVGDLQAPALSIGELRLPVQAGRIGILAGGPGLHLAGFSYDASGAVDLGPPPPPAPVAQEGIVPAWSISDAFPEQALAAGEALDEASLAERTWTELPSEPSGLVDLARVNGIRGRRNTVFARTVIQSERAQTKRMDFGFSDRAVVYLDGRALYRGNDSYRSRDYRFLGSIGYFDTLYLPLAEGENELVVAVSEDFGGWGVQARFPDTDGLSFG